jgi:hypothetical protein
MKKTARFAGLSFWAQNVGTVNASNVRVEVRIPKLMDGLVVTSGHRRPRRPRGVMDIALGSLETPSIDVHRESEEFVMTLDLGTLQPKVEYWERRDFIVSALESCELPTRVRIFADDLPNPLEVTLTLNIKVDSRIYTEEELRAVMTAGS